MYICQYIDARTTQNRRIMEKNENPDNQVKTWICSVCGYQCEGIEPPKKCPKCGVDDIYFDAVE